jgi:hypothetical protein
MPKLYLHAESVEAIATRILPLNHAELATARIQYIFVEKASMKNGRPVLGKVRKITGAIEFLIEKDFMVEVALDIWNTLEETKRVALVDHLLERCTGEEDEETAEMSWTIREPDVQEFTTILRRHGAWTDELAGLISVAQSINVDDRVQEVVDAVSDASVATELSASL